MAKIDTILKPGNLWFEKNRGKVIRILIVRVYLLPLLISVRGSLQAISFPYFSIFIVPGCTGSSSIDSLAVLGLILALMSGMFVAYSGPGGVNAVVLGMAGLIGLLLFDMLVKHRELKLVPSRTTLPLLIFMLICFLSFGFGQLPWFTYSQRAPLDAQLGG
jgi:hypothetical protein